MEKSSQPLLNYQFTNLLSHQNTVKHAIFTRLGGISSQPFDTLNIRHGIGDNPKSINHNRHRICKTLNIHPNQLISANQTHSTNIYVIKKEHDQVPPIYPRDQYGEIDDIDAFITNKPGQYLMIQVADCQPIVIFDPVKKVIANIHSGWRGSLANIAAKTIQKMVTEFGTTPADCLIGVGPSLGPCCAEFINHDEIFPSEYQKFALPNKHIDFWSLTKYQLHQAGVEPGNVEISAVCTTCNTEEFFSYRAAKSSPTGRFGVIIGLTE